MCGAGNSIGIEACKCLYAWGKAEVIREGAHWYADSVGRVRV